MAVLIHVIIAIFSIIFSSITYLVPSRLKIRITEGLVGGTVASGTYLVLSKQARLAPTCVAGLVYVGIMTVGIYASHRKLAKKTIDRS